MWTTPGRVRVTIGAVLGHSVFAAATLCQFSCPTPAWKLPPAFQTLNGNVQAILPDGASSFIAGGKFTSAGGLTVNGIARWDGTAWQGLSTGLTEGGFNPPVLAIAALASGDLVAGGDFTIAGGVPANFVAKWNGRQWTAMGAGFTSTASNTYVDCLAALTDGNVVAGGLMQLSGSTQVNNLARWDGSTWMPFGQGLSEPFAVTSVPVASCLAAEEDGQFIVGGNFKKVDGVSVNGLARWTGVSWQPFGDGLNERVLALDPWVSPSGESYIFVAGRFSLAGNAPAIRVARWTGTAWEALGAGIPGTASTNVFTVKVLTENANPVAYFGGSFKDAGGVGISSLATWNGTQWNSIGGTTTTGFVYDLAFLSDGQTTHSVLVGGDFIKSGSLPSSRLVVFGCETPPSCVADCDASGSLDIDDFVCFQTHFALGNPAADCDASGSLDIDDFICFQTIFAIGC